MNDTFVYQGNSIQFIYEMNMQLKNVKPTKQKQNNTANMFMYVCVYVNRPTTTFEHIFT